MAIDNPGIHPNSAPEYMISGIPFVTGSSVAAGQVHEINFKNVTKTITIRNYTASTAIAVGFTQNGLSSIKNNYFILSGSESFSDEIRCTKLFISGAVGTATYVVVAGLTRISERQFPTITGSDGFNGVG